MSTSDRQNSLFVSEDWTKIYQTFRDADFTSYDFETIRATMVQYLRNNYPEDFNDYIESSEFIALMDLIAYFGQSLAIDDVFRVDFRDNVHNLREDFCELVPAYVIQSTELEVAHVERFVTVILRRWK